MYVELYMLDMSNCDVILGMDWMSSHYARVDCMNKEEKFEIPDMNLSHSRIPRELGR